MSTSAGPARLHHGGACQEPVPTGPQLRKVQPQTKYGRAVGHARVEYLADEGGNHVALGELVHEARDVGERFD